jgi:deoxycytidylate deaminase
MKQKLAIITQNFVIVCGYSGSEKFLQRCANVTKKKTETYASYSGLHKRN